MGVAKYLAKTIVKNVAKEVWFHNGLKLDDEVFAKRVMKNVTDEVSEKVYENKDSIADSLNATAENIRPWCEKTSEKCFELSDRLNLKKRLINKVKKETGIDKVEANVKAKIDGVKAGVRAKVDGVEAGIKAKVDDVEAGIRAKVDGVEAGIRAKVDGVEAGIRAKVDGVNAKIESRVDEVRAGVKAKTDGFFGRIKESMKK